MKSFSIFCIVLALVFISNTEVYAQGCVAIKSTGGTCSIEHPEGTDCTASSAKWLFSANARYFKSFRHYRGKEEQKERLEQHTEVINYQGTLDLSLTRVFNSRWSLLIDVPLLLNDRSSLYEHGLVNGTYVKNERRNTGSQGIGDVRVAAYRWMLNPVKVKNTNIRLGLGLKLPTGKPDYKDYWYNVGPGGSRELRTVDQSIQPGDGGLGVTAELSGFYNVKPNFGFYGNFFYLANPREQNGVRTYRETLTPALANEAIMSVPDQYMARAGFNYSLKSMQRLVFNAGARIEGIPVYDLIGGSGYFRRPGYIWSVEPGFNYQARKLNFYATVPVAIVRNRTQSVTDKENSKLRGTFVQGDAAFADYSINMGVAFKL